MTTTDIATIPSQGDEVMEFIQIAQEATARWQQRVRMQGDRLHMIRAGRGIEMESPERIQKRLKRLADSAKKANTAAERMLTQPASANLVQSIGLERVIGKTDFLDLNFIELALAVARFVGRINLLSPQGRSSGYGTGFMVSPRLLLTNNHVLPSPAEAQHSLVEFDFQNDRTGRALQIIGFRLEPTTFFMTNEGLDFTLIAVSPVSRTGVPLERYGWSRLIADQGKVLLGEPLNIIQHPLGQAKQVVLRSNELVELFEDFAYYVADTEPGSSGSPVYNDQWEVVALHHSGVIKQDSQGNYLAKDGSIWTPGMDPDDLAWIANEGIRVSSLVDYIAQQPLTGLQAQLRHDLLHLEPPSPLEAAAASQDDHRHGPNAGQGESVSGPTIGPGGATWTIPLSVTVQLAGIPPAPVAGDPSPLTPLPAAKSAVTIGGPHPTASQALRTDLAEALAASEKYEAKEYYDAGTDAQARNTYYANLDPAASSLERYDQLHQLLESTHTNRPSYKPAKHLYPWVDLQPPGHAKRIASIYSGERFDARDLIRADFEADRRREVLRESFRSESLLRERSPGADLAIEKAAAERFPYNCEHVVPQSWFAEREPMRGDLHHLFACEEQCNNFRGRIPYDDFPDYPVTATEPATDEVIRNFCGKRETTQFEPFAGKGAVARATLYFLIRYPKQIRNLADQYSPQRIQVLLSWHKAEPVSEYERHRNAAIFEAQGNRNPLIDFPEWADSIDFVRGLG